MLGRLTFERMRVKNRDDGTQRFVEHFTWGLDREPPVQASIGGCAFVNAPRPCGGDDEVALAVRDASVRPCHLNQRDEMEQQYRVRRVPKLLEVVKNFLVFYPRAVGQPLPPGSLLSPPSQFCNQLELTLLEILVLQRPLAPYEAIPLSHRAPQGEGVFHRPVNPM